MRTIYHLVVQRDRGRNVTPRKDFVPGLERAGVEFAYRRVCQVAVLALPNVNADEQPAPSSAHASTGQETLVL